MTINAVIINRSGQIVYDRIEDIPNNLKAMAIDNGKSMKSRRFTIPATAKGFIKVNGRWLDPNRSAEVIPRKKKAT